MTFKVTLIEMTFYILINGKNTMVQAKKNKKLGFQPNNSESIEKKGLTKEPKGRLISWSPWPPADFKTRYPAFPLVMTIIILIILRWIISTN